MGLISTEELLALHEAVAELFRADGEPFRFTGPREPGLPDAAVYRAHSSFGERDFYPSGREKTAALVHGINSSHVFRDGNKRTSVAVLAVMLDRDDWHMDCEDDQIFETIVALARNSIPFDGSADDTVRELTSWIRANTTKKQSSFGDLKTEDFLSLCEEAGGSCKDSGTSWVVKGLNGKSVRISKSTRELTAHVVSNYRSRIGLSESWTGLAPDQFYGVAPAEVELVLRYRGVMRRLAAFDHEGD